MAVANNLLQGKNGEWALLKRHPDEDIFGIQIAAGHADVYTRISEVIENEGIDVDFVDLNLGCPIDVICNFGCGVSPFLFFFLKLIILMNFLLTFGSRRN